MQFLVNKSERSIGERTSMGWNADIDKQSQRTARCGPRPVALI